MGGVTTARLFYFVSNDVLISFENVSSINLISYIVEAGIITVGDDGLALRLELGEVVDDLRTEECRAVFKGGLVDDDLGTLGLDTFHDALDGALTEVVGVALHRETIDTDGDRLLAAVILVICAVSIPAGLTQHLVGNEVLTGAVALDDGGHHILRHVGIVGQELFGVLWQAVAAIAEARVVIVGADTGIKTDARDDCLTVETLDLGIGIELVEVADTQGEVGVGEELHRLGLGHAHQETRDTLVDV